MKWLVIFFNESTHTETNLGYVEAETLEGAYKECGANQQEMEKKYRDNEDSITIIEFHEERQITSPAHLADLIGESKQEELAKSEEAKVSAFWILVGLLAFMVSAIFMFTRS
jgi:hypothetical protein